MAAGGVGRVWFVGAGPGAADPITLRAWRLLQQADLVLHDSPIDPELLRGLRGERVFVGKRCGRHSMPQKRIGDLLVEGVLRGLRVVRLKGGDPSVLGRVGEEALRLVELGIPFEIVPGVTSAVAVPAVAEIPVTHRGIADAFVVGTAHRQPAGLSLSIPECQGRTTLVLPMSMSTVEGWQTQLIERGQPADLPIALISAGCTPAQRVVETNLARVVDDLRDAELATPVVAVVGWEVTLRARLHGSRLGRLEVLRSLESRRGGTHADLAGNAA